MKSSTESLRAYARAYAERSAQEQGLPPKVQDPQTLNKAASILRISKL